MQSFLILLKAILFGTLVGLGAVSCGSGSGSGPGPGNPEDPGDPGDVQFQHDGLDNRMVVRLYEHDGQIFAGTDQGLYVRQADNQWQARGLAQREVLDIAIIDSDHFIASVRQTNDGIFNDSLMETTDGGQSWQLVEHNFGGDQVETIFGLHYDGDNNALYATGAEALAVSYDEGRTWELLNGVWGAFSQPMRIVKRNPATNDIWYGGQNALEQMVLQRYSLDTQDNESFPGLLPSPAVIFGIQFDPQNDQVVYASGEGGVLKTQDNGAEWMTLIGEGDHRFYFDIAIDPFDSEVLYTGGWDKGEESQTVIFEMSTDGGNTWSMHEYTSGGVRSVLATEEAGTTVVYLGLYGGGIVRVTPP